MVVVGVEPVHAIEDAGVVEGDVQRAEVGNGAADDIGDR